MQDRVHQEPEKAAREVHSLVVGDAAGREKLRQMLLNAAEGKEMMTALDLDSWWQSYTDSYLLDLADAGVNEILQYSEERMLARLGFVKNVNLEYRTPLGGRTGYGALSFLGALAEKEDSVVAWQLRASHNEDAESGLNAGLIFRHARDKYAEGDLFAGHPMLLGLNAFLDFETHAAGNFLRYSVGGEIRTGALDFYGNYYIPLSDTKLYEADGWRGYTTARKDLTWKPTLASPARTGFRAWSATIGGKAKARWTTRREPNSVSAPVRTRPGSLNLNTTSRTRAIRKSADAFPTPARLATSPPLM